MNALIISALDGEILPPGATVRVIGKTHPLNGGRIERHFSAGLSIAEILRETLSGHPDLRDRGDLIVRIDGHLIEPANWHRVRVKAGATVTFLPRLSGGNALKTVFGLVVAVAAFLIAGPAGSWLAASAFGTAVGLSAGIATAFIAGGIILAGSLALNALFPVPAAAQSVTSTALNSVQGAQNQANPFGPIPVVLGTHRQSPYYAAKPYTEIVGDDQYLRLLFCLGYGPLNISALQIGETPIASFAGVTIETRQGFVGDAAITLYPGEVDELGLSINLINTVDAPGINGTGGIWNSQTSAVGADEISVDFTAPQGISATNGQGGPMNWSVTVATRYRIAGTTSWTNAANLTFATSHSPSRLGLNIPVARGQYEVQTSKLTGGGDPAHVTDSMIWTALRSTKHAAPITFPKPLALVALRIKATDQLSGVINTFNCICSSLVLAYSGSGSTWNANTASQNPADLFRWVLQGPSNARPVADALINISNLQDWWTYCVSKGFKFNQVINAVGSVYDKLCDIAASGRAVPTFIDGKWGVIWDRPADSIVQHFTQRNSWGFQGQKPYAQQPNGWRVSFINELNGYTQDERIVYDDGFDSTNATLFEGIRFPGVTDPALIWKHGRFQIAQARLRPEKISLNVGWENLVCTRGDRVAVTHDVLLIGLNAGRVKSVAGQVVTFDELVTVAAGKTYGMSFRLAGTTSPIVRALDVTSAGDYNSLTLVGDLTGVAAELGCLFAFGETASEYAVYRVQVITHQKDLIAALTLVDDAQAISTADSGTIPPYTPNITIPADPFTLPPRNLQYLEVIDGSGAAVRAQVSLIWQVPRFGNIASFQVQRRDDDAGGPWTTVDTVLPPATSSSAPVTSAGVWSFRVRCIFDNGTASDWTTLDHITLQGLSKAPAPIANLRNTFITGREFLSWDSPVDLRPIPIEIRKGASFASAQIIEDSVSSPWQTVGDDLYWVTSYATSPFGVRNYSSPTQSIQITDSVATQNVVVRHDEAAEKWHGTCTGYVGIDTTSNFVRTAGSDPFLSRADFLGAPNFLDSGLQGGGFYWSPTIVNTGGVTFCRVSNDWTAAGVAVNDDFLGNADFLGNPDFLKSFLSQFVRVRPIIQVSQVGPSPVWGPVQVWSPDVYQGWMFQLGIQFEILPTAAVPDPGAIAVLESWVWTIDVPDRLDSYQNLTVPSGAGLAITFRPTGAAVDVPFNGGLNAEALPHLTPSIRNPNPGDMVTWTGLSLSGVTLTVMNAGVSVGGSEINVLVRGY
jgi:hypothetical protein